MFMKILKENIYNGSYFSLSSLLRNKSVKIITYNSSIQKKIIDENILTQVQM